MEVIARSNRREQGEIIQVSVQSPETAAVGGVQFHESLQWPTILSRERTAWLGKRNSQAQEVRIRILAGQLH